MTKSDQHPPSPTTFPATSPGSVSTAGSTSMAHARAVTAEIAEHGGWSAKSAVVHEYVRREEAWRRNPMRNVL